MVPIFYNIRNIFFMMLIKRFYYILYICVGICPPPPLLTLLLDIRWRLQFFIYLTGLQMPQTDKKKLMNWVFPQLIGVRKTVTKGRIWNFYSKKPAKEILFILSLIFHSTFIGTTSTLSDFLINSMVSTVNWKMCRARPV